MKRQRNMQQIKENYKNPKDQIYGAEIGNLLEKEFRVIIVKMIQDLSKRMEARQRQYRKCLIKRDKRLKEKIERKNIITAMKSSTTENL